MKIVDIGLSAALFILGLVVPMTAQENQSVPAISRNYTLQYVIKDTSSEIENTLTYFVDSVLRPGDQIILITPAKVYSYPKEKLGSLSAAQLKEDLVMRLRSDTVLAGSEFHNIYEAMEQLCLDLKPPPMKEDDEIASIMSRYRALTKNLSVITAFNAPLYLKMAAALNNQSNRNRMIIFLGQVFVPVADEDTMDKYSKSKSMPTMIELFRFLLHEDIDIGKIKDAFRESKIRMDLIYCNKKFSSRRGMDLKEVSLDLYNAYKKIAEATGGEIQATYNPAHQFQEIVTSLKGPEKNRREQE